ncbi:hypothetical protein AB0N17_31260 [Streptomyces sp. NPDC051133]|uniref:hypothetical protein n=1 Tax=Streptomyces sp. NPDC051133 TaxID=3155521 RepID=UPI0034239C49
MADEQYKWLNRRTAERLLRGESLEAVDARADDQAERLSRALGALSGQAAPASDELPGEQAALAAFRKAREASEAERTAALADAAPGRRSGASAHDADAGLVRIGSPARTGIPARRPRWARPVRLALAAVVAAGTVGGVAMAAGSGVLPGPFRHEHPAPGASVSSSATSGAPLGSVSPQATPGFGAGTGAPSGGPGTGGGHSSEAAGGRDGGTGASTAPGSGAPSATSGAGWKGVVAACRDIRDGKGLDTGRKRALENLAGGSARVSRYCRVVLSTGDSATPGGEGDGGKGQGDDNGKGKGGRNGDGKGDDESHPGRGGHGGKGDGGKGDGGKGDGGKKDGGRGDGGHGDGGREGDGRRHHRHGAAPAPTRLAPAHPDRATRTPETPSPSPSYSAL